MILLLYLKFNHYISLSISGGRINTPSSSNHPSDDGDDDGGDDGDEDEVAHDKNDDALQRAHEVYSVV